MSGREKQRIIHINMPNKRSGYSPLYNVSAVTKLGLRKATINQRKSAALLMLWAGQVVVVADTSGHSAGNQQGLAD